MEHGCAIGKRSSSAEHHWQEIEIEDLKDGKPKVFCFSGKGTYFPDIANGFCKIAEGYLKLAIKEDDKSKVSDIVDIVGFVYPLDNKTDNFVGDEFIDEFVDSVLLSCVQKNGNSIDVNETCRRLAKITFFTYCGGNKVVYDIVKNFNEKLSGLGISDSDKSKINKALMHLTFSPHKDDTRSISTVSVVSNRDGNARSKVEELMGDGLNFLDGVEVVFNRENDVDADHISIVSSALLNDAKESIDEHDVSIVSREKDWSLKSYDIDGKSYRSNNADCVSLMMAMALSRRVENSFENHRALKFIPFDMSGILLDDFKSIKGDYSKKDLAVNEEKKYIERKFKYEQARNKQKSAMASGVICGKNPWSQVCIEIKNASNFDDVLCICENNCGHYIEEIIELLNNENKSLTFEQILLLRAIKDFYRSKRGEVTKDDVLEELKTKKNIQEMFSVIEFKYDGKFDQIVLNNLYVLGLTKDESEKLRQLIEDYNNGKNDNATEKEKISYKLQFSEKSFEDYVYIFNQYDYKCAHDFLGTEKYLYKKPYSLLKKASVARNESFKYKKKYVNIPSFEQIITFVSSSTKYNEIYNELKKYNFVGLEYVLPYAKFLSQAEIRKLFNAANEESLVADMNM